MTITTAKFNPEDKGNEVVILQKLKDRYVENDKMVIKKHKKVRYDL